MKKLIGSILAGMTVIAILYCNYCAVRESKPLFKRMLDSITGSKPYTTVSGWVHRVTDSNLVQGTKTKVKNTGGRLVHMFDRSSKTA